MGSIRTFYLVKSSKVICIGEMLTWQAAVALLATSVTIGQATIAELVPGAYIVEFADDQVSLSPSTEASI